MLLEEGWALVQGVSDAFDLEPAEEAFPESRPRALMVGGSTGTRSRRRLKRCKLCHVITVPVVLNSFMLNVGLVGGPRAPLPGGAELARTRRRRQRLQQRDQRVAAVCVRPDSTAVREMPFELAVGSKGRRRQDIQIVDDSPAALFHGRRRVR